MLFHFDEKILKNQQENLRKENLRLEDDITRDKRRIEDLQSEIDYLRQENVELNERFTQTALSSAQDALKALQK